MQKKRSPRVRSKKSASVFEAYNGDEKLSFCDELNFRLAELSDEKHIK